MRAPDFRSPPPIPRTAVWLGAAGLIPFAIGAAALWSLPAAQTPPVVRALLGYGAVILSFVGAVHWGLAMGLPRSTHEGMASSQFSLSVVPALTGWAALLLPPMTGIAVLAVGFAGVYALDRSATAAGIAPAWYVALRTPLSAAVITLLAVGGAAIGIRLS